MYVAPKELMVNKWLYQGSNSDYSGCKAHLLFGFYYAKLPSKLIDFQSAKEFKFFHILGSPFGHSDLYLGERH